MHKYIIRNLFEDGATYNATATFPVTIAGLGGFESAHCLQHAG
jgi:hypothetical protein